MTTFHKGPANGATLLLLRGPDYLRLAEAPGRTDAARFYAFEGLKESPPAGYTLHAYRRLNPRERFTVAKGMSKYVCGEYEHVEDQPDQDVMRENATWQAWCIEQKTRGQVDPGEE